MPMWWPRFAPRGRSRSPRRTYRAGRATCRPSTRSSVRRTTRGIPRGCRRVRPGELPHLSRSVSLPSNWAPTSAARSAGRPPTVVSLATSPATAWCPAAATSPASTVAHLAVVSHPGEHCQFAVGGVVAGGVEPGDRDRGFGGTGFEERERGGEIGDGVDWGETGHHATIVHTFELESKPEPANISERREWPMKRNCSAPGFAVMRCRSAVGGFLRLVHRHRQQLEFPSRVRDGRQVALAQPRTSGTHPSSTESKHRPSETGGLPPVPTIGHGAGDQGSDRARHRRVTGSFRTIAEPGHQDQEPYAPFEFDRSRRRTERADYWTLTSSNKVNVGLAALLSSWLTRLRV